MPILFPHNQIAYDSAAAMLRSTGRAAVIHPTGTGKSFIGFQLCIDNPDATVCWLSPSAYIYRTQCANLEKAGAAVPGNIKFFTYARLMGLGPEELAAIRPGYIILDEFHRCGAEMWGRGVNNLLAAWPDAPVLGLSATSIRYLDNCRDMADELFDGCIASEMTLGEAVVRGILTPPKYVMTLLSCRKELERYESRLARSRSRFAREEGQRYIDELHRRLDNARGLDEVFGRHMQDRTGKYIVFCSNFDHMRAMEELAGDWFRLVDSAPRIYSVYSYDPGASQAFADFTADRNDDHLRLLYCIDALNEGIHLDDISGVILLRPTVSPIVFKQQIGRAMSAGGSRGSVIFDIVDNISGLYGIDALREEMSQAMDEFRYYGESGLIINDRFSVIDELKDCRELFSALDKSLSASWDRMFALARDYAKENGNLLVPAAYATEEGYNLGRWLISQRISYSRRSPVLTEEKIKRLESIGMCWGPVNDRGWMEYYGLLRHYRDERGNTEVPADYISPGGKRLGVWVSTQRSARMKKRLSQERVRLLDELGFSWCRDEDRWDTGCEQARLYRSARGNLNVPPEYITADGYPLGSWLAMQRTRKKQNRLSARRIARLEALDICWNPFDALWDTGFEHAARYYESNGNLNAGRDYIAPDGFRLGSWLCARRTAMKNGTLSPERIAGLDSIGMVWNANDMKWHNGFAHAREYYRSSGNLSPQRLYTAPDGFRLGEWLCTQRRRQKNGTLSPERLELLKTINF